MGGSGAVLYAICQFRQFVKPKGRDVCKAAMLGVGNLLCEFSEMGHLTFSLKGSS